MASKAPVEAPDGTAARPVLPSSRPTSTSTVGLPRESRISRATTTSMDGTSISFFNVTRVRPGRGPAGAAPPGLCGTSLTAPGGSVGLPATSWTEPRVNCFRTEQRPGLCGARQRGAGQHKAPLRCVRGKTHRSGEPVGTGGDPHEGFSLKDPDVRALWFGYGPGVTCRVSLQVELLAREDEVGVVDDVLVQLEQLLPAALDLVLLGDRAERVALDDLVLAVTLLDLLAGRGADGLLGGRALRGT